MLMRICSKIDAELYAKICNKSSENRLKSWKIHPKSVQNPWKINKNRFLGSFGAFLAQGRAQVGSGTLPGISRHLPGNPFWPKMAPQGSIFGTPKIPKWLQNQTFGHRLALGPSKNGLREGFRKKKKNLWKMDRKIIDFWVPGTSWTMFLLQPASAGAWFSIFHNFRKKSKNRCQKGAQKLSFFMKNGPLAVEGSIVRTSWDVFGRFEKSSFFRCRSGRPKIDKNRSLGRPGVARVTSTHGFGGSGVLGAAPSIKEYRLID
jgi:hypothetical protein